MSALVLITACTIVSAGQPILLNPGDTIADTGVQAAALAQGAIFAPTTDVAVAAAALVVQKLRSKGANEVACQGVMMAAYASTAYAATPTRITVDVPLSVLQAKTSGAAFNVGPVLPAGAVLVAPPSITVVQALAGAGPVSAAHATVQASAGDAAGALVASTDIFTATGTLAPVGSNPYPQRGGQQLQMTVTTVGGTMAGLTAGHVQLNLVCSVAQ